MPRDAHLVNIHVKDQSIDEVLKQCFNDQPLTFTIKDHLVIVSKKDPSLLDKVKNFLQPSQIIRGRVLDENNQPLVGATVKIKGHKDGGITDKEGIFLLNAEGQELKGLKLEVTYVGYEHTEVSYDPGVETQVIHLKRSLSKLDEVHVVAYGEATRRFNVGSISQVTAADIEEQPVANPLAALEGRVPGLVVTQSSGLPGSILPGAR